MASANQRANALGQCGKIGRIGYIWDNSSRRRKLYSWVEDNLGVATDVIFLCMYIHVHVYVRVCGMDVQLFSTTITGMFISMFIPFAPRFQAFWNETTWFWFCDCSPRDVSVARLSGLFDEHITIELRYIKLVFSTTIYYKRLPGFATDCPCGVWPHGLTARLMYICSLFKIIVLTVGL